MFYEGTVEDITERKIAEDQLKLSEEKYRLLFTDANEGILILDMKGRIIDANAKLFSITGYAFHEIVGKSIIDFAAQLQINVRQIVRDYKDLFVEKLAASDWTIVNRAGEKIDITIKPSYIKKEGKNIGISTIISDITERKQAEEKIKFASLQWRSTFDAISDAIALLDLQGTILRCNRAMAKFSGKNFSELIGKNCAEMLYGPGKRPAGCPYLRAQKTLKRETLLLPLDNRWFEIAVDPEFDDKKNLIGFVHIMSDVTERKKTEKQIKAALLEKEVLLKEVHHRVKNNLQTIISLLNLQAHRAGDAKISQSLEKCKQRIFSMAMVHAELYKSDDFSYINFKSYLDKLVKNMVTSYQLERKIEVDLQIDDINFDIDTAIPCGLLLNELIANSIKHAFPKNCSGKINISLQRIKNKNYELRFQDDGIGLPENFDIHKSHTLGMVLINTLTAQLRGKLEIQTETGTIFNIVFPRKKK
jgi:PAS domain S-box-containing protein